jgi:hypothetical protein
LITATENKFWGDSAEQIPAVTISERGGHCLDHNRKLAKLHKMGPKYTDTPTTSKILGRILVAKRTFQRGNPGAKQLPTRAAEMDNWRWAEI